MAIVKTILNPAENKTGEKNPLLQIEPEKMNIEFFFHNYIIRSNQYVIRKEYSFISIVPDSE
jgi:hypothetical protein